MKKEMMAVVLCGALAVGMSGAAWAAADDVNADTLSIFDSRSKTGRYNFDTESSDAKDISIKVTGGETSGKVYRVDVTWESLEFTYDMDDQGTWNPDTHTYDSPRTGTKWGDQKSTITVTNHSNDSITATAAFSQDDGTIVDSTITTTNGTASFSLDKATLTVESSEDTTFDNANSDTFIVSPSGVPDADETSAAKITVTISKGATEDAGE